jgi:endonuclease YncB( thermonuclease family)
MKNPFASYFQSPFKTEIPSDQPGLPDEISWEDTIPYIPPVTGGRVIKVYDGDTITVATRVHDLPHLYRFSVRLDGIDCPEIKTKNSTEKSVAVLAKQHLVDSILGKDVELRNVSLEKYGRILAEVWYGGESMNLSLVEARLAVAYDGGKKRVPENWLDYHMKGSRV